MGKYVRAGAKLTEQATCTISFNHLIERRPSVQLALLQSKSAEPAVTDSVNSKKHAAHAGLQPVPVPVEGNHQFLHFRAEILAVTGRIKRQDLQDLQDLQDFWSLIYKQLNPGGLANPVEKRLFRQHHSGFGEKQA